MWKTLTAVVIVSALFLGPTARAASDITNPGDTVVGVPNDGDWPAAETPPLAIDNDINTKYLHFKGDFDPDPGTGGAGFRVTPGASGTIVTGLTFTTANDTPGRDPISFQLSGSNVGIDGPYTVIATGNIVDFSAATEWPRFTINSTPITFANSTPYDHYQIIFTAIRGPVGDGVNSMQIAEVELLGDILKAYTPTPIRWRRRRRQMVQRRRDAMERRNRYRLAPGLLRHESNPWGRRIQEQTAPWQHVLLSGHVPGAPARHHVLLEG